MEYSFNENIGIKFSSMLETNTAGSLHLQAKWLLVSKLT